MKRTNLCSAIIAVVIFTAGSLMAFPNHDNDPEGELDVKKAKVVNTVESEQAVDDSIIAIGQEELGEEHQILLPPADDVDLDPTNVENKLELEEFSIYPNPSDGNITLGFTYDSKEPITIEVFGLDGKTVYSNVMNNFEGIDTQQIDLSQEPRGFYFVKISQGGKQMTKKIIIK